MSMVEKSAVGAQWCQRGEVKSPRMAQTDEAGSAGVVQALQEVQPMTA
ncbi:MAG: hypothetical protein QM703_07780 [Gemmatales bacterium]